MRAMVEVQLFEEVADVVVGLVPPELGRPRCRARRSGIKVWFGAPEPPREHYEAQLVSADVVDGARWLGLEVGFHCEHPQAPANDAVVDRLVGREREWRRVIGREAVVGEFLGRREWRRISETWADPDLDDPGLAFEVGARLTDYISAIEPLR